MTAFPTLRPISVCERITGEYLSENCIWVGDKKLDVLSVSCSDGESPSPHEYSSFGTDAPPLFMVSYVASLTLRSAPQLRSQFWPPGEGFDDYVSIYGACAAATSLVPFYSVTYATNYLSINALFFFSTIEVAPSWSIYNPCPALDALFAMSLDGARHAPCAPG